ncbi:MAG: cupin domain-containing protein [Gemmatimonadota bacterium]|nr:MAG: cupin domain-containing protein [Gemmatimonadota bacterium]
MKSQNCKIDLNTKYGYSELIDVPSIVTSCREEWFNQTLCQVNDCVVRLGIVRGEFHWHKHEQTDEFFFVLKGRLVLDVEGDTVELNPHQGYTVPKGVEHRTRAPEGAVMLMVEDSQVHPLGD